MTDQLTDRASKATEEIQDYCALSSHDFDRVADIIDRHMREWLEEKNLYAEKSSFLNEVESKKSGTSVIRWTRYDGMPETLPDFGEKVLLTKVSQRKFYPVTAEFEIFGGLKVWNDFTNRMDVRIGDLWAPLPEPPEGME